MPLSSVVGAQSIVRPGVCTSSTRPASPYEGQVIYETDTDKTLVWNGSGWVFLSTSTANPVGLELVKTQTVGTAVSSQDVTSCFSSTYHNYLIMFSDVAVSSNANALNLKLLSGTTATTSGFYGNTFYIVPGNAGGLTNATYSNTSYCEAGSVSTSSTNCGRIEILGPNLAAHTRIVCMLTDNNYLRWHSANHSASTSYDGFQLFTTAGTMTGGTIRVYGYKN